MAGEGVALPWPLLRATNHFHPPQFPLCFSLQSVQKVYFLPCALYRNLLLPCPDWLPVTPSSPRTLWSHTVLQWQGHLKNKQSKILQVPGTQAPRSTLWESLLYVYNFGFGRTAILLHSCAQQSITRRHPALIHQPLCVVRQLKEKWCVSDGSPPSSTSAKLLLRQRMYDSIAVSLTCFFRFHVDRCADAWEPAQILHNQ